MKTSTSRYEQLTRQIRDVNSSLRRYDEFVPVTKADRRMKRRLYDARARYEAIIAKWYGIEPKMLRRRLYCNRTFTVHCFPRCGITVLGGEDGGKEK